MAMTRVMVAGATGVVGRQLVPQLVAAGYQVTGTTRTAAKAASLREAGATPVVLDALDAAAVGQAVAEAEPDVIIDELTALAGSFSLRRLDRTFAVTNELRVAGTDHLLAAASATARRPARAGPTRRRRTCRR
jgi:2-alkyl-3-oxoalkanoate reductase